MVFFFSFSFLFCFLVLFVCLLWWACGLLSVIMMEAVTGRGQVPYKSSVLLVWLHPCSRSSKPSYLCKAAPLFDLLIVSSVKWEHVMVLPCKVSWGYGEWTLWNSSCPCETVKGYLLIMLSLLAYYVPLFLSSHGMACGIPGFTVLQRIVFWEPGSSAWRHVGLLFLECNLFESLSESVVTHPWVSKISWQDLMPRHWLLTHVQHKDIL